MSDIYLLIEGQQQGPYSEEQVRESLAAGQIPSDLPAWHEGLPEWVSISNIVPNTPQIPPLPLTTGVSPEVTSKLPPLPSNSSNATNGNVTKRSNEGFACVIQGLGKICWGLGLIIRGSLRHFLIAIKTLANGIRARISSKDRASLRTYSQLTFKWLLIGVSIVIVGLVIFSGVYVFKYGFVWGTDSTSKLKDASEFADLIYADEYSQSAIDPEDRAKSDAILQDKYGSSEAQSVSRAGAEAMLNAGLGTKKDDIDTSLTSLLVNDLMATTGSEIQKDSKPCGFPYSKTIWYVKEAPDIAIESVDTSDYYYLIGVIMLGRRGHEDRLMTLMSTTASTIESITGEKDISEEIIAWFKNPNGTEFKSGHVLIIAVPLPRSPIANVMFIATIDSQEVSPDKLTNFTQTETVYHDGGYKLGGSIKQAIHDMDFIANDNLDGTDEEVKQKKKDLIVARLLKLHDDLINDGLSKAVVDKYISSEKMQNTSLEDLENYDYLQSFEEEARRDPSFRP